MFIYRPLHDDIAQHARPLISFLEKKIEKEFGLSIKLAFEKEAFIAFDSERAGRGQVQIGNEIDKYRSQKEAKIQKMLNRDSGDGLWPLRSPMEQFESEKYTRWQYEFKTPPTTALRAVLRMDAQSNRVEAFSKKYAAQLERMAGTTSPSSSLEEMQNAIKTFTNKFGVNEIQFMPFKEGKGVDGSPNITATQVNVSLWKNGKNLFLEEKSKKLNPVQHAAQQALRIFTLTDMAMMAPTDECFKRLNAEEDANNMSQYSAVWYKNHVNPERARLELRTPSVLARHDLCVLVTLAALYDSLKHPDKYLKDWRELNSVQFNDLHPNPKDREEAIQKFAQESDTIRTLLDATKNDSEMHQLAESLKPLVVQAARANTLAQPGIAQSLGLAM